MTADTPEWRPVVGYGGTYEVSSSGRVRSLPRTVLRGGVPYRVPGRELTPSPEKDGHLQVSLRRDGRRRTHRVHRLVAEAFLPQPAGIVEVCHNDGDPSNNWVFNLRWDTHAANMADAIQHGVLAPRGPHKSKQDRCWRGHPFTPENTYLYNGRRNCRACQRVRSTETAECSICGVERSVANMSRHRKGHQHA